MAVVANTFSTTGTANANAPVGNREELSNVVDRITPEDTPLYSMMAKGRCTSTEPEWEIDELAAPALNAHLEGDEFDYSAISPVTRVSNATQIFRKAFLVSRTQDAVSNAGDAEKTKYQTLKKSVELRKDIEFALLSNTATVKTGGTRKLGSLPTWLTTNTVRRPNTDGNADSDFDDPGESGGIDGGYVSGVTTVYTKSDARRTFTKDLMDDCMEKCYGSGADIKHMVMSPFAKREFSGFIGDADVAALRTNVQSGQATLIGAADMYQSDFGLVSVIPNRILQANPVASSGTEEALRVLHREMAANVYFVDPSKLEFKWLRPIQKVTDITANADATPTVMIGEGTLCVKNEAGIGVVGDIFGTTPTI